jgi:hypothetical protein
VPTKTKALSKPIEALPQLDWFNKTPLKWRDPIEVQARVMEYLQTCEKLQRHPTISGLALTLNVSRMTLYRYRKGGAGLNAKVSDTLNKAIHIIEESVESRLLSNKLNPSSAIFWLCNLKNEEGWSNKHQMEHSGGININISVTPFGKKANKKKVK